MTVETIWYDDKSVKMYASIFVNMFFYDFVFILL